MPGIKVCAFYQFARWPEFALLQARLQALCDQEGIRGFLLLASEGINGTLAGAPAAMDRVMAGIRQICGLPGLEHKASFCDSMPFLRMKVRLKAEIIMLGAPGADPLAHVGTYVEPADWNQLIADPEVLVLDTRNSYETAIGTFERATDPDTASFSDFPAFVQRALDPARHRKIALFCTGGIRCEKASSYLLSQGFSEVYHLRGGILKYLEEILPESSRWQGACFVFDERVAVGHGLKVADIKLCYGCGMPLTPDDVAQASHEPGVSCPHCIGLQTPEQKASARERQRQMMLAQARGDKHLGPK